MKNNIKTITKNEIVNKQLELQAKSRRTRGLIFNKANKTFMYSFLFFWCIIYIFPFFWAAFSAFKNPNLISTLGLNPFPATTSNEADIWTLQNYRTLFGSEGLSIYSTVWLQNSVIYSVLSASINAVLNILGGYTLASIAMKGKRLVVSYFLVSILIPSQATFVPSYYIFSEIGIISRDLNDMIFLFAIIMSGMANIVNTFMARQFFLTQTPEMEQSAKVEGYSQLKVFFTITMRKMLPLVATQFVLVFMGSWNNFLIFQLYSSGIPGRMTITSGTYLLMKSATNKAQGYGQALAMSNISFVPMIILYSISLRIQLRGIRGGNK